MSKFTLALAAAVVLAFSACDNEVELLEDAPAVPIVYGVYNADEAVQTLSITKTFRFAEGGGALESASNPDSLYYPAEELNVEVVNLRNNNVVTAERVNAADDGVVREPGVFPVDQNIAYRYESAGLEAEAGDSLQLNIFRNASLLATTTIVRLPKMRFVSQTQLPPPMYQLTSQTPFRQSWRYEDNNLASLVEVYELGFLFAYTETGPDGRVDKLIYWPGTGVTTERSVSVKLDGLFTFLSNNLEADPAITREFRYMQLLITSGDDSFRQLRALVDANRGITSTQELPPFTNVEGAIGLFGSISQLRQMDQSTLGPAAFDALFGLDGDEYGVRDLNFRP